MRAPDFWWRAPSEPGVRARLLSPLGALYAHQTARRLRRGAREKVSVPVICVGNINVGGTGKTPTVIALIERVQSLLQTPAVVSRGYGGRLTGPVRVDPRVHVAADVGDEALLLAAFAEVWVSRDRASGARAAVDAGAQVVILDDALQNPSLYHDLTILVVDAETGFGNARCLPAGPLREPVEAGLKRADFMLTIGEEAAQRAFDTQPAGPPRLRAALLPLETGMDWAGLRVLAFAGIGRPEKFFATLRALGADLRQTEALGDHAALSPALLGRLQRDARAQGAQLVTTEKDAARLPHQMRREVLTLPVRLSITEDEPLMDALRKLVSE